MMKPASLVSKPHYLVLDGLRGVAALIVVVFHIFEAHATSHLDQIINHGYLAVDFFFLLSGFVIGYAYDDRWSKMSPGSFIKRRLTRLQPMIMIGMLMGALCFYFQDSVLWPGVSEMPVWKVLLTMGLGFMMIPVPPSFDIRGWQEMYPLNGPGWTLFFEYIANFLYGVGIRKFSKSALSVLVFIAAGMLIHLAVTSPAGDIIGGWSLQSTQLYVGFTRVMYPFFAGLLLFRMARPGQLKNAFTWCSLLIVAVLSFPRIGGSEHLWINGLYDSLSIILVFPLIVWLGASAEVNGKYLKGICKFFGDISYPVYITHYPIIYIYTGWVHDKKVPLKEALGVGALVFICCIALGYVCLKLYDEPVRRWLTKKIR